MLVEDTDESGDADTVKFYLLSSLMIQFTSHVCNLTLVNPSVLNKNKLDTTLIKVHDGWTQLQPQVALQFDDFYN